MRWMLVLLAVVTTTVATAGPPTVVFLSDFGTRDDAVATCKGVMLQVAPGLRVIDLTHDVKPFSVADGARLLADTAEYYPAGTVFLAVIDPGVGSSRKPMLLKTKRGQFFVLPDNGLATLVAERQGVVGAREIASPWWMRPGGRSSTFHGRDVFAPAAAHVARGDAWRTAGPPIEKPVQLEVHVARIDGDVLKGEVIATDGPYGNLITNVDASLFATLGYKTGDDVPIELGAERLTLPFQRTFSDVPEGSALLFVDSRARIGVAINRASFAEAHHVTLPVALVIRRRAGDR